jgi:hypothetical protein
MASEANIHLEIALQVGEISFDTFRETAGEMESALRDIEQNITGKSHKVDWKWADEPVIRAVANPNGVPSSTLEEIVRQARLGFKRIVEAKGGQVNWPKSFGPRAKKAIQNVVRKLDVAEAITVDTSGDEQPLVIEQITLQQRYGHERPPKEIASIDGVLEAISVRGRLHVTICEHGTGKRIRCILPEVSLDRAKDSLGQRVVVEGTTSFNLEGEPTVITEITDIWPRPKEKQQLEELRGAAPDFTEGESAEEYVHNIRGHRDGDDE